MPNHSARLSLADIAISLKQTVLGSTIFDQKNQKCLAFYFDISANYYGYDEDGNTQIHKEGRAREGGIILMTANTFVWAIRSKDLSCYPVWYMKKKHMQEFDFVSSHDSCFRDAVEDYFRKMENEMLDRAVKHVPENEREAARNRTSIFTYTMGKMFEIVECDFERFEKNYGSDDKKFIENEWLPIRITFEEKTLVRS